MQKFKKQFYLVDGLETFKKAGLKARAQIFLISLIALYHERERSKGGYVSIDMEENSSLDYKVIIRDKDITKKFNIKVDTIWRIRDDLEKLITINFLRVFERGVSYPYLPQFEKNFDHEFEYSFGIEKGNRNILKIPTSIIYNKDLTSKQKLSILWSLSLEERYGRFPRLKEIEKESGISDKTIRKAKEKYPQLFIKY